MSRFVPSLSNRSMWYEGKIFVVAFAVISLQCRVSVSALDQSGEEEDFHEGHVLQLKLIDGPSRHLVSDAEVWLREGGSADWIAAGNATDGTLSIDTSKLAEFELMVKAAQFPTYRSVRLRTAALGDELVIDLPLNATICARLIAPFPELAATFLIGHDRETPVFMAPAYRIADDSCDASGRFLIERDPEATAVVVVHDIGFACVPMDACFEGMEITLQPWQTLRGRLMKNGKAAPNENVVAVSVELPYATLRLAGENFTVETDAEGQFTFNQTLPPGRVTLVAFDQIQKTFAVRIGKPAEVIFDCVGKNIEGALTYAGPEEIDWSSGRIVLLACGSAQESVALDNLPGEIEEEECYSIEMTSDGTFSSRMIPAGNYKLLLTCNAVDDAEQMNQPLNFSGNIVVNAGGDASQKFHVMLTKEEQTMEER